MIRVAALVTAAVIVVASLAFVAALAITGHLNEGTAPYVVSVLGLGTTAVPSLIAVATTQQTAAKVDEAAGKLEAVHGLVNGNYGEVMRVLSEIAQSAPSVDAIGSARAAVASAPPPAPPESTP